MKLLSAMYELRRVSCPKPSSGTEHINDVLAVPGETVASPKSRLSDEDSIAEQIIQSMLHETEDDIDHLEDLEKMIESAMGPVSAHGGSRHATNCVFRRTLSVVRRKKFLLRVVDDRTIAYEVAHARRREYYSQLVEGLQEYVPPELLDIRKFITANSYRESSGASASENRDAESLVGAFMLPAHHKSLEFLRELIETTSHWG